MVWPLLAAGAIGAGGALLGGMFGGSKKEYTITEHAPYETYAPQTTDARVWNIQYPSYQVMMNSPLGSQTTKKEMSTAIEQRPSQEVSPQNAPNAPAGTNWTTIAIIGSVAIVAYALVSRKK